jgi:hypothetical protein
MPAPAYALAPDAFLRSLDASRDTLGRRRVRLLDIVDHVTELTGNADHAVIGGLAQILWARKSHTDDLDVALSSGDLASAVDRIRSGAAPSGWSLPRPPDAALEADDVIEVPHAQYQGSVVDLIAFRNEPFNAEVIATARSVAELGGIRFIRPGLLLVTHLPSTGSDRSPRCRRARARS